MLYVRDGVVYLVALILSICVHEYGHAVIADRLGDPLPRAEGRVTLNPLVHIDPIGTILFPIIAFATAIHSPAAASRILGWGKPVRISLSARAISRKISVKTAHLLIAMAGPLMNIVFALVLSGVYLGLIKAGERPSQLAIPVASIIGMNVGLAFFNLIPCPPLDGGAILNAVLPRHLAWVGEWLERYGGFLFLALLMTGALRYFMIPARIAATWWLSTITGWAL